MKNAIILCSDSNYFLHVAALFGSLLRQGISKNADMILIADSNISQDKIQILHNKGIKVVSVTNKNHGYHLKYNIYNRDFSVYNKILYLDVDMTILRNDVDVFSDFDDNVGVDFEPFSLHQTMVTSAPEMSIEQLQILASIPDKQAWNSGGIIYRGKILEDDLIEKMYDAKNKYMEVNYHTRAVKDGGDQPIFNIVLDKYNPVQSSLFSYWKNITKETVFAHCCANEKDRPWNNPEFLNNYKMGLEYFERI